MAASASKGIRFEFDVMDAAAAPVVDGCRRTLAEHAYDVSVRTPRKQSRAGADGYLHARGPSWRHSFAFEAKNHLNAQTVPLAIRQAREYAGSGSSPLVLGSYINDSLADQLRHDDINYIDGAGNAYLETPHLHVWFRGGRRQREMNNDVPRMLGSAALRVVGVLLAERDAVNWPYRQLAAAAGVALGSVSHAMSALRRARHLRLAAPGRNVLTARASLLEKWELGYAQRLRPSLQPRVFRTADDAPVTTIPTRLATAGVNDVALGGELAAALADGQLRPGRATVHVQGTSVPPPLARALKLVPDPRGYIDVVQLPGDINVWSWPGRTTPRLAHPLLVHAELDGSAPDDRVLGAARLLFERNIAESLNDPEPAQPR